MTIKSYQIDPAPRVITKQAVKPTTSATNGAFYPKEVSGVVEAFYVDSQAREIRITNNGGLDVGGGGEANTGTNLGTGAEVFKTKNVANFEFRKLKAGTGNISVTQNTLDITIDTTAENNAGANIGTTGAGTAGIYKNKSGADLQFRRLVAGSGVTITENTNDITVSSTGGGSGEINTHANEPAGTGVGIVGTKNGVQLRFKTLKQGSNVVITSNNDDVTISASGGGGGGVEEYEATFGARAADDNMQVRATGVGVTYSRTADVGTLTIPVGVKLLSFTVRTPNGLNTTSGFTIVHGQGPQTTTEFTPPTVQCYNNAAGTKTIKTFSLSIPDTTPDRLTVTGLGGGLPYIIRGVF